MMILIWLLILIAVVAFVGAAVQAADEHHGSLFAQAVGLVALSALLGVVAMQPRVAPMSTETPVTFTFSGSGTATLPPTAGTTTTTTVPVSPSATDFGGFRPHPSRLNSISNRRSRTEARLPPLRPGLSPRGPSMRRRRPIRASGGRP